MADKTFTFNIKAVADMKDVQSNIQNIQSALKQLKLPESTQNSFKKTFGDLEKELDKYQKLMANGFKTKGDASALEKSGNNILHLYEKVVDTINSLDDSTLKKAFEDIGAKEVENLKNQLTSLQGALKTAVSGAVGDSFKNLKSSFKDLSSGCKAVTQDGKDLGKELQKIGSSTVTTFINNISGGRFDLAEKNFESLKQRIAEVKTQLEEVGDTKTSEGLDKWIANFSSAFEQLKNNGDIQPLLTQIAQLKNDLKGAEGAVIQGLVDSFKQARPEVEKFGDEIRNTTEANKDFATSQAQVAKEIDQIKSRIQYFFGLSNAINLVKRAIRGAVETIKELDKAMTATAVVTDFSVNDMWEQLPEYTKRANELGVTTLAAYEAATLYYQQGLKTNEVNALSVETLKMARIAGLDAAEATDRMTNALRGFNMELTEANAQRVDDVYSELAANTASNVDEISTAMTKVASLAHNANMEFETTAAFLAQIIETTRESAETAGTALKTVVARFSEVKKLVGEGELTGTDEEGQAIDVNKVSQALRTAGIDMNKYFLGEVGLDDIFMELASKWDSLTALQQRYIATQAAGSRQQSRFIAMMSDYARTQELVGKAYNANGAAARQFEKTQDSLESKLARLKNAWDEFLMGLTNNQIVKSFVDLLTDFLNTINKLTSAFDEGTNTILKWGVVLGGILGGKQLFKNGGLIDSLLSNTIFSNILGSGGKGSNKITSQLFKGGLLNNITASLQLAGESTGIVDLAGAFSKLGTGIKTAVASMKAFVAASWPIVTIVAAVAGFAALTNYNEQTKARRSDPTIGLKEQVEEAKKFADQMSDLKDQTSEVAKQWNSISAQQSSNLQAINTAESASAYRDSIIAQNDYIKSLIEKDAQYSQYVSQIEGLNGEIILTLDEDALANAAEKAARAAAEAAANSYFSQSSLLSSSNALLDAQINQLRSKYYEENGRYYQKGNEENYSVVYNQATGQSWAAIAPTATLEIDESQYKEIQSQISSLEAEKYENNANIASIAAQAYREIGSQQGFTGSELTLASQILGQIFDPEEYNQQIATTISNSLSNLTESQLRARYFTDYGVEADSNMGVEALQRAIAQGTYYTQHQYWQTQDVNNLINSSDSARQLAEAFAGNIELTTENAGELLGYSDELAKALKLDPKVFATKLVEAQRSLTARKGTAINQYGQQMLRGGIQPTKQDQNLLAGLSIQEIEQLNSAASKLSELMPPTEYRDFLLELPNLAQSGSEEFLQISQFLTGFNLDNPIKAFQQLRQAQQQLGDDTTSTFAKIVNTIAEANKDILSTGSIFQSFALSDEYSEIESNLKDLIKTNGRISAKNVEELAKSCSSLRILLEEDKISAQGLAEALTLLQGKDIPLEAFNTQLLEVLSNSSSLEESLDRLHEYISNFDKGIDYSEGSTFFTGLSEELSKFIDSYSFGNERTQKLYEAFFGAGSYSELVEKWADDPEAFARIMQARVDAATKAIDNNSFGFMNEFAGNKELGISRLKDGPNSYNFKWDTQGRTTNEMVKAIQDAWSAEKGYAIGEEYALAILQGWLAQDPKMAAEIRQNELFENLKNLFSGNEVIGQAQFDAIIAAANLTEQQVQEVLNRLKENNVEIPIIAKWQDENGNELTGDALQQYFNEINAQLGENGISFGGVVDLESTMSQLQAIGLTAEQSAELINKNAETLKTVATIWNGTKFEEQEITITPDEDIEDKVRTLRERVNQAMSDSLKKIEGFNFGEGLQDSLTTSLQDAIINAFEGTDEDGSSLAQRVGETMGEAIKTAIQEGLNSSPDTTVIGDAPKGPVEKGTQLGGESGFSKAAEWITNLPPIPVDFYMNLIGGIPGMASGGVVKSRASGSNHEISSGFALTGEEGPEIVWNKNAGYAYVTGGNGPEFQNLQPGDRVFNAAETSRIFRNSSFTRGGIFNSYGSGGYNKKIVDKGGKSRGPGSGSGSGSKDSKKESTWRNELDWLYDLMEDIAEYERQQTIIQDKYDLYLKDITKTGRDLYNLTNKELSNLKTQLKGQQTVLTKRTQEMGELQTIINSKGFGRYLQYNQKDKTLEIDWDAIEKITDKEKYDELTDLISRAEDIQGKMDDAEKSIWDIKKQIQDLQNRYLQKYLDFQSRVQEAVVAKYQKQIDNLSELNDTLNDTNSKILDSIQKEIDLERQIRDNTNTENEIADLESRLAYLMRDTTGANAQEIRDIQKQIEEARENYSDTLVDQAVDRLSQMNEDSATQREQQVELMQAQLDYWQETGALWGEVAKLIETGFNANGSIIRGSELVRILRDKDEWKALSDAQKDNWANELILETNEVGAHILQLAQGVKASAETIRASISGLKGKLGGTPEHSYTAEKVEEKYATGGLNTYTGLAHLDGTPSEPEYVLNARQTDAFLRLADVLPAAMDGTGTISNTYGGNVNLNLTMNIDEIGSDYDVDRLANRVKEIIYNASSYRNVNTLNFIR